MPQDTSTGGSNLGRLGQAVLKLYPRLLARLDAAAMSLPQEALREAFGRSASDARRIYESLLRA